MIGAERPEAADGRTFATLDPATGREIAHVPHAGPADVAGAACRRACCLRRRPLGEHAGQWSRAHHDSRLRSPSKTTRRSSRRSSRSITASQSTLLSYVDVAGSVAHLRYFAGWPTKIEGAVLPVTAPEHALLHAPRAGRRVRADRALELPADDGRSGRSHPPSRRAARSC